MAKKQKDYLDALLSEGDVAHVDSAGGGTKPAATIEPSPPRRNALLGRESALARIASGEVRQITQLSLDPAKVRPWAGNARSYKNLNEHNCRELIDAIIAEGGQKLPAIVRRVEGDPDCDFEVIAGTRRHWSISWLRQNSYPDMKFIAQIVDLDDEAAFRIADIENRARKDVSDLERARNYKSALAAHYGNHVTRMAERLKVSKGWLSKMLRVAEIPEHIIDAFGSNENVRLAAAYPLAQALDDTNRAPAIHQAAKNLASQQASLRDQGMSPIPSGQVLKILLEAQTTRTPRRELVLNGAFGRPAVSLKRSDRNGIVLRLHADHGLSEDDLIDRVRSLLDQLARDGLGLRR